MFLKTGDALQCGKVIVRKTAQATDNSHFGGYWRRFEELWYRQLMGCWDFLAHTYPLFSLYSCDRHFILFVANVSSQAVLIKTQSKPHQDRHNVMR